MLVLVHTVHTDERHLSAPSVSLSARSNRIVIASFERVSAVLSCSNLAFHI